MGKLKTLEDTCLNRSLGGSAASLQMVANTLGLSRFAASHPRFSIAAAALRDILTSPVYSRCEIFGRILFGCKVFALIGRRGGFYPKRTPREIFVTSLIRVLPANIVDKIRN